MPTTSSNTSELSSNQPPFNLLSWVVRTVLLVLFLPVLLVLAPLLVGFVYLNPMFQISRSRLVARKLQWGAIPL